MKNYNRNNRSERANDFSKRRGKDSRKSSMHQAICDNCGKECEVPFKPTSGKPIFCSNCFEKNQYENPKKFGKGRSDRKFKSRDSRKRSFDDKDSVMHNAVCDNCGKDCEVPFRPLKNEFGILNKKLDKILEILIPDLSVKNYQEELEEETEKPKLEKKTKKKAVIKKGVKKKA